MNKVKCQNYITFTIVLYQSKSLLSSKPYISMSPNTSPIIVHIFSENSYDQMGIVAKMSYGEKSLSDFATLSSIPSSGRPCISSDESNVLEMDNENFNALNLSLKRTCSWSDTVRHTRTILVDLPFHTCWVRCWA